MASRPKILGSAVQGASASAVLILTGEDMKLIPLTWHTERILCPSCGQECAATVEHTWPWYSYVHTCECGYIILEQEWERAPQPERT
jgi:acetone carboxylase gamma subunit